MLVPRSVFAARKVCDKKGHRTALRGVKFERDAEGRPFAVASDGFRLVALTWKEEDAADYPPVDFDLSPNPNCGFVVPYAACDQAAKAKVGAKASKVILRNIAVGEHLANSKVPMVATDEESTTRLDTQVEDGLFPDWRACVPQLKTNDIHVRLDPRLLRGLLEVIESHVDSENCEIVISLNREEPAERPVTISAAGPNHSAVGVIMPKWGKGRRFPDFTLTPLVTAQPTEPAPSEATPTAELPPSMPEVTPAARPDESATREPANWKDEARSISIAAFV